MAQKSFPFNSISGDRKYKAEDFRQYFAQFIGNGVVYASADALKVKEHDGMQLKVCTGGAWIDGTGYLNNTEYYVTLETADGALPRIDRIVLRCDYTERALTIQVKKGTYSAQPVAQSLQRDADAYELALADVTVGKGVIKLTQSVITDQRLNGEVCGIVTGLIEQADTTEIFNQFQTYLKEFKQAYVESFSEWAKEREDELLNWKDVTENDAEEWIANKEQEIADWQASSQSSMKEWEEANKNAFMAWQLLQENTMETWQSQKKAAFTQWQDGEEAAFNAWLNIEQQEYEEWLDNLKAILDDNVAGNLQNEIEKLQESIFDKYYGLAEQTTEFIDDYNIRTTNAEAVIETQFGYDEQGNEIAVTAVTPTGKSYSYVKTSTFYYDRIESKIERRINSDGV
jgi:hypothetical protein